MDHENLSILLSILVLVTKFEAIDKDVMAGTDSVKKVESTEALDDLLAWSDVLSICCPLTQETDKLINQATLSRLKPGAYIINVTRGEIIDEDSLVEGYQQVAGFLFHFRQSVSGDDLDHHSRAASHG